MLEIPIAAAGVLRDFCEAGMLRLADFHVARRLAQLAGEADPTVTLALALAVRELRLGSVCLDLVTAEATLLPEADLGDAQALVIGIGRVGSGAAHQLAEVHGLRTLGVEQSRDKLAPIERGGLRVIEADGTDVGLLDAIVASEHLRLVLLALPSHDPCLDITHQLKERDFVGVLAAAARYEDHARQLRAAGVDVVLQVYAGAGAQLADEANDLTRAD